MSGFIASPPAPASPPDATVNAGTFWPAIDLNLFRDTMRIGGTAIPEARVKEAIIGGIITVGDLLHDWRDSRLAEGRTRLQDVPADQIDGTSRLVLLWRRAVHAMATADLIETHADVSATKTGADRADVIAPTADDHRRNATHAIRDILGQGRTAVELI